MGGLKGNKRAFRDLERVEKQWAALGEKDPLWAILAAPEMKDGRWNRELFFETGCKEVDAVIEIAAQLGDLQFGTAVDFGCGVGRLSQALVRHFDRVIGIDVADSMVEHARYANGFPDRCEYLHNSAADLTLLRDESVDLVYSSITLQHVGRSLARSYIREFFRISRRNGMVVFQLPSKPRSWARHFIKKLLPVRLTNWVWQIRSESPAPMESYFLPQQEISSLVKASGGQILRVDRNDNGPPGWESRTYFCLRAKGPF